MKYRIRCDVSVVRDFRHPLQCKWDVRASGTLRAMSNNSVPTFRDNTSISSSKVKKIFLNVLTLQLGPIDCPETSVQNYHSTLRNTPEERKSLL
jgi:hypothetical protein